MKLICQISVTAALIIFTAVSALASGAASESEPGISKLEKPSAPWKDNGGIEKLKKIENPLSGEGMNMKAKAPVIKEKPSDPKDKASSSASEVPHGKSSEKLLQTLTAAAADRKIDAAEALQFSRDITAILNRPNVSSEYAVTIKNDAIAIIEALDISVAEKQPLKNYIETIVFGAERDTAGLKAAAAPAETNGPGETSETGVKEARRRIEEIRRQKNAVREKIEAIKKGR